ncbi:MAG: peptide methionine sulfoxide reductase [Lactococcus petauri]|uniref:peptide methionine sulfoxide reductase n=1 Tax=Lactococcus petauri TaxID=1940789 RepID=UPI001E63871F|nr:peptide methionine sulfoxide reductase [Lactococcus petauri]MDC0826989.1 peptide methionine sulfoxide reductase [Lactococcus petauri]
MQVLATYSLSKAVDFILYLYEKENEETLWETWLSKDIQKDFKEFKQEHTQPLRVKQTEIISKEQEQNNLDFASQFIKFD